MFTFGLGSGCDKDLITKVAKAGRGTHTIVQDGGEDINGQVIQALQNAMQPSLKEVEYGWNGSIEVDKSEVFRNSLINSTTLIKAENLSAVEFNFNTARDPMTM